MTAPIVQQISRRPQKFTPEGMVREVEDAYAPDFQFWVASTQGQLWRRIAEGRRRD